MIGQRIFPDKFGHLRLPEGGYGRDLRGRWWVRPLGEDAQKISARNLIEHGDGTITVKFGLNGSTETIIERGIWIDPDDEPDEELLQ